MYGINPLILFADTNCQTTFFGFVPWNYYLKLDPSNNCMPFQGTFSLLGAHSSILLILLAILDDLFRAVGLLAVVFIIYAGAKFILSQGSPDEAAKARTTIIHALVGLAITLVAIAFVSFIGVQAGNGTGGSIGNNTVGKLVLQPLPNASGAQGNGLIQAVLSIAFAVLGAISFLVIAIAGMRYVLAQGDANAVGQAKATIAYALVGLLIAIAAQSIVSLVLNHP